MTSPNRQHKRNSFFKYMPASTAEIVLKNRTLRWSSPLEFNDPFDVPRKIAFNVSPKEIQQAFVDSFIELIETPPKNTENLKPILRLMVEAVKKPGTKNLKAELIEGLKKGVEKRNPPDKELLDLQALWREWLPQFRILCLSESQEKASMWYHYADKYQGVVLEILCIDELDSAWLTAKKVEYPETKPHVHSAQGWATLLNKPQQQAIQTIMHTCLFTKSPDWSYEDEWRISSFKRPLETGTVSDYKVAAEEFGRLYLGPHIKENVRENILAATEGYPNIRTFETMIGMGREFIFKEIEG